MSPVIEARGLTAVYRPPRGLGALLRRQSPPPVRALDALDFSVGAGEIFGLVGPNGAGKTTLIKILATLLDPSDGRVSVGGHDVVREPAAVRRIVGLVSSNERSFYWRLSGRQNLRFFARLHAVPPAQTEAWIAELLDGLQLTEVADRRFDAYSTGMRQRLAFARGLLGRPQLLFMDEPTKGLDPASAAALIRMVRERIMAAWRPTIVITSHQLVELERLCDRIAILSRGRFLRCGTLAELQASVSLQRRYRVVVAGLDAATAAAVAAAVDGRAEPDPEAGAGTFAMAFDDRGGDLSRLLRAVFGRGGEVHSVSDVPVSLEDVFTHVVGEQAVAGEAGRC